MLHIVFFNSVIIIVMNYEWWNHSSRWLVFFVEVPGTLEKTQPTFRKSLKFFIRMHTSMVGNWPSKFRGDRQWLCTGTPYTHVHQLPRDTRSQHWWNFRQRRRCNVRFGFQSWNDVLFIQGSRQPDGRQDGHSHFIKICIMQKYIHVEH